MVTPPMVFDSTLLATLVCLEQDIRFCQFIRHKVSSLSPIFTWAMCQKQKKSSPKPPPLVARTAPEEGLKTFLKEIGIDDEGDCKCNIRSDDDSVSIRRLS